MEKLQLPEAGYKIINLLMMESNFKREVLVTFNNQEVQSSVNISVDCNVNGNQVFVNETVNFEQKFNDKIEITASITMVGVFEKVGEVELSAEDFGNINGAAIIFPFLREQLSNLSLKSGIGQVILPPANFVQMYKDKKDALASES